MILKNIRLPLFLAMAALTLIPALGSLYAVNEIIHSSMTVGLQPGISGELDRSSRLLKQLAGLDPKNESDYHAQFKELQTVRHSYETLVAFVPVLRKNYLLLFALITGLSLAIAGLTAHWIHRRVIRTYTQALQEMRSAQARAVYLENRASWRTVALKLVHEVKNPLTPLQLMLSRLPKQDPELRESARIAQEEVAQINTWIESFAKFARIPEPKLEPVELKKFLNSFVSHYSDLWPSLTFNVIASEKSTLQADPGLLKQVLFNLCKNAAEAASGSPITLVFEWSDPSHTLSVTDTGAGIPEEFREHLFQPYQSTKTQEKGMGLGLAIARNILRDHGGEIRYVPTNTGTRFELEFKNPRC